MRSFFQELLNLRDYFSTVIGCWYGLNFAVVVEPEKRERYKNSEPENSGEKTRFQNPHESESALVGSAAGSYGIENFHSPETSRIYLVKHDSVTVEPYW